MMGFMFQKKTKTIKCPRTACGYKGDWDEFQDLMNFDFGMIEDRFYRHKSDYIKDMEIKRFDKMIDNFVGGSN